MLEIRELFSYSKSKPIFVKKVKMKNNKGKYYNSVIRRIIKSINGKLFPYQ